ncbi:hypothetical protein BLNAU_15097 [Blattamonas nauphoetae]|uniref:B30.2/SPRY domain-containing protein n=1 Tax=Blattamonas nauphoetae TaxID=2049346 RepID=A0ABQ9XEY1_9EUKA|nr:hypothetical protein BLNAU_15097 [Blattamonas nauphoetae]
MSFVRNDNDTLSIDPQADPTFPSISVLMRFVAPLLTLPPMTFTDPSHFSIDRTTITRTEFGRGKYGTSVWSSALLSDPFTSGVVSVTITILSLEWGSMCFGLMDSNSPIHKHGEALGFRVENSVGHNNYGVLICNTPSSHLFRDSHSRQTEGDCVRMEVDLDSTPRTVQFFMNGEAGWCYVSGIPSSVRIGCSTIGLGTSLRIDNISHISQPTPISEKMRHVKW